MESSSSSTPRVPCLNTGARSTAPGFQQKRSQKNWQKWRKLTPAVPRSPQDTEEALTPHKPLQAAALERARPQVWLQARGQEGAEGECPNLLFFTRHMNHAVTEHLQIILFLILIVSCTCSPTPPALPKGRSPPHALLPAGSFLRPGARLPPPQDRARNPKTVLRSMQNPPSLK